MHIFRFTILTLVLVACSEPPSVGALRVHPSPVGAELFVDGVSRGLATEGLLVEIPAGPHVAELRQDGRVLVTMPIEVRAAFIVDAQLIAPEQPALAAAAPAPVVEAAPPSPDPTPLAEIAEPAPEERSRDAMMAVIRRGQRDLQRCYEQELRRRPEATGRISVEITVHLDASGAVSVAQLDTEASRELTSCMGTAVRAWEFGPGPPGATLTFPVVFESE